MHQFFIPFFSHYPKLILSLVVILATSLVGCGDGQSTAPKPVYMWFTTQSTNGNIGGVSGADTICETEGSSMAFASPISTHRAVIATNSYDSRTIVDGNRPVHRPDGTFVIDSYSNFFDVNLNAVNHLGGVAGTGYWTGITVAGRPANVRHCSNWTSSTTGQGFHGDTDKTDYFRISSSSINCGTGLLHILCLSF